MPIVNPQACSRALRAMNELRVSVEFSPRPLAVEVAYRIYDAQDLVCKLANAVPGPDRSVLFTAIRRSLRWNRQSIERAQEVLDAAARASEPFFKDPCLMVKSYLEDVKRCLDNPRENHSARIFRG